MSVKEAPLFLLTWQNHAGFLRQWSWPTLAPMSSVSTATAATSAQMSSQGDLLQLDFDVS